MKKLPTPSSTFTLKKDKILSQLALPDDQYTDSSPKGSVDAGIRGLIDRINNTHEGLVTTSSCAGRVSVYLEGRKAPASSAFRGASATAADGGGDGAEVALNDGRESGPAAAAIAAAGSLSSAVGGKGGGEWLFVSHDPVTLEENLDSEEFHERLLLGLEPETVAAGGNRAQNVGAMGPDSRLIHFKFEPMILHILTASLEHAQLVVQAGMEAGFRETGAVSLLARHPGEEAMPMVAVRSMGLSFESLIGVEKDGVRRLAVPPQYLKTLVQIGNERFIENKKRIARLSAALDAAFAPPKIKKNWEDAQARRERKRQEGLRRQEELKKHKDTEVAEQSSPGSILQIPELA
ncbi:tRNA wybutosine-synthesizing protein [Corynascus novoguineensis]|uniref:tRNA(Phe) 7-[(3-amino-3-carboxypropyl)-4-demethylwyosine(37)-N(4)]-methyltransferase n=1 Tax=Corynascus novoguineensis TaxID=1126955 RepID=A0AAN7HP38_9PEZI|nr:tRNA wybutosine-synthesizing protein [Corynascus novoguineensis]